MTTLSPTLPLHDGRAIPQLGLGVWQIPNDETEAVQGRGWAVLKGNELHGMIFFHEGDDSEFVAKRADSAKPTKKRK